jgi:hypothetical protein
MRQLAAKSHSDQNETRDSGGRLESNQLEFRRSWIATGVRRRSNPRTNTRLIALDCLIGEKLFSFVAAASHDCAKREGNSQQTQCKSLEG